MQTAERMRRNSTKGIDQSAQTAKQVGLRSSGVAPENLPVKGDISSVKKQIKSTNKKMKNLDVNAPKDKEE